MDDLWVGPMAVAVGEYQILVDTGPPTALGVYRQHAQLVEDFDSPDGSTTEGYFALAVSERTDWPHLVVTQRFAPAGRGFAPGVLLVPAARQLFIGAGTRLLGYEARSGSWRRSWIDEAEFGFWGWRQHDDVVLMSAELELAAWTTSGDKLWTTFVEPPWSYQVRGGQLELDVMGRTSTFDVMSGPHSDGYAGS